MSDTQDSHSTDVNSSVSTDRYPSSQGQVTNSSQFSAQSQSNLEYHWDSFTERSSRPALPESKESYLRGSPYNAENEEQKSSDVATNQPLLLFAPSTRSPTRSRRSRKVSIIKRSGSVSGSSGTIPELASTSLSTAISLGRLDYLAVPASMTPTRGKRSRSPSITAGDSLYPPKQKDVDLHPYAESQAPSTDDHDAANPRKREHLDE